MADLDDLTAASEKAQSLASQGRWQDAKLVLGSVRDALASVPHALCLYAEACSRLNDPEPARAAAQQALEQFRRVGDPAGTLKAATLLGIILFDAGELRDAQSHFAEALTLTESLENEPMRARIWNNLGTLHAVQEQHADAERCYRQALEIHRALGDGHGEAQTLHNLGIAARDLEQWSDADQHFTAAARAAQAAGDQQLFAFAIVERAHIALHQNDLATAERMARLALIRFDAQSSLFGLAEVHMILGRIAHARGAADEALGELQKAREKCDLSGVALLAAEIQVETGRVLASQGALDQARQTLRDAAASLRQIGRTREADQAERMLHDLGTG